MGALNLNRPTMTLCYLCTPFGVCIELECNHSAQATIEAAAKLAQAAAVYAVGMELERVPYRAAGQGGDAIVALMVLPSLGGALAVALISLRLRRGP